MPDALELPGMGRAVIPLVCARDAIIGELVSDGLPGRAAIVRALHGLAEPAARLRCIQAIRVYWGSFHVIHLPPGKVGTANLPLLALTGRGENECAFARADQNADSAHEIFSSQLRSDFTATLDTDGPDPGESSVTFAKDKTLVSGRQEEYCSDRYITKKGRLCRGGVPGNSIRRKRWMRRCCCSGGTGTRALPCPLSPRRWASICPVCTPHLETKKISSAKCSTVTSRNQPRIFPTP